MHLNSGHRPALTVSLGAVKTERNTNTFTNQRIASFFSAVLPSKGCGVSRSVTLGKACDLLRALALSKVANATLFCHLVNCLDRRARFLGRTLARYYRQDSVS